MVDLELERGVKIETKDMIFESEDVQIDITSTGYSYVFEITMYSGKFTKKTELKEEWFYVDDREEIKKPFVSWSQFRRLRLVKGENWWVNEERPPNGIGPVCLYCDNLIDWGPRDHSIPCPVRKFSGWEDEVE